MFGERTTEADLAALRAVLPADCHIRLSLASTEAATIFHWFVSPEAIQPGQPVPCGYLARAAAITLLDEAGMPAGPGEPGELVVRGETLALGAWQDGRMLPGPFVPDPAHPLSRVYHTGDIIRLRSDGLAAFVGRRDRRTKIRGLRADPADLEEALRLCAGVADAAVVVREDDDESSLVALIVPEDAALPPDLVALRAQLASQLPAHLLPAVIRVIATIPRLPSFKPDLVALQTL